MLTLLILCSCILAGFLLRRRRVPMPPASFLTWLVWGMLFVFGVSIGSNREIVGEMDVFGLRAFILALAGVVGSAAFSWILWKFLERRKRK